MPVQPSHPVGGSRVHEMVKGSNVSLSSLSEHADSAMVSLSWSSPSGEGDADVSVLLIDASGKVRSNSDFYFYNNPTAADGSVAAPGIDSDRERQ